MRRILFVAALLTMVGCNQPKPKPPPAPSISVEEIDTTEYTGVTVYYKYHSRPQNSAPYVTLNSPEEIQEYRKQVEFLLKRLDEAEGRMNVHEPEPAP